MREGEAVSGEVGIGGVTQTALRGHSEAASEGTQGGAPLVRRLEHLGPQARRFHSARLDDGEIGRAQGREGGRTHTPRC